MLPQRDLITTLGEHITNDCLALTDKFKFREDNSGQIEIHPDLNCASSPRSCVRVLVAKFLSKILVASTRMHPALIP